MLHDVWFRIRSLLWRGRAERDLADELQFHQECEREELVQAGLGPADARRQAALAFGGFTGVVEACRDVRGLSPLTDTAKDVRYAWRSLRRQPVFALTVVGSLALGVGANVTIYALMRAALWRPLAAVEHPNELVHVRRADPTRTDGGESSFSYVLFQQLRETAGPGARIVAKSRANQRKFGLDPAVKERVSGEAVSDDFFNVLGVRPAAGRLLTTGDDDRSGGRRVAVLSHRFWEARFASAPSVVGSNIYVDEAPFTVVGVAAPGFDGVDAEKRVDVWLPVTSDPTIDAAMFGEPHFSWLTLMARLHQPAAARMTDLLDRRFRAHLETELLPDMPPRFRAMLGGEHVESRPAASGLATMGRRYEPQLRVLAAIAVCVFLICSANIATLVRARNERRRDEMALRRALGASSGRLFRQLLVEGVLLCAAGVGGSLLLGPWLARLLLQLVPVTGQAPELDVRVDATVLGVAAALGVFSAIAAITIPAWRQSIAMPRLRAGVRLSGRMVIGRTTVALQLATVLILLVVAGLSLSMLRHLTAIDLGFEAAAVETVELSFPKSTEPARAMAALESIRMRLAAVGGIEKASYSFPSVYDTGGSSLGVTPVGYTPAPGEDTEAGTLIVGPGFFETLSIPLYEGRTFTEADLAPGNASVIVNETFERKYFAPRTAVGRSVQLPGRVNTVRTIVGVVADVRHYGVRSRPWPMVYEPGRRPLRASSSAFMPRRPRAPSSGMSSTLPMQPHRSTGFARSMRPWQR